MSQITMTMMADSKMTMADSVGATTVADGMKPGAPKVEASNAFSKNFHHDDSEHHFQESLYDATNLQDFLSRRIEPEDMAEIKRFVTMDDYDFFKVEDPHKLFEKCCFSLAISDSIETERIVAAAFLDDKPKNPGLRTQAKLWKTTPELQRMVPLNTLYVHLMAKSPEVPSNILITEILAYTFVACTTIEFIILECPDLQSKDCYAFSSMVKEEEINVPEMNPLRILIYDKNLLFPQLRVREGRENDLDDLAPLLPMPAEMISKEFGRTELCDVIALSEKNQQSVVAEWNTEAVGMITVSTDIDYDLLNHFYFLEPFHGLHKPFHKDKMETGCCEVKNVNDVPIEKILDELKQVRDKLKGRTTTRQDKDVPYTTETRREDFQLDYDESDDSVHPKQIDDAHRQGHQFGLSVSNDIIYYGLKNPKVAKGGFDTSQSTTVMEDALQSESRVNEEIEGEWEEGGDVNNNEVKDKDSSSDRQSSNGLDGIGDETIAEFVEEFLGEDEGENEDLEDEDEEEEEDEDESGENLQVKPRDSELTVTGSSSGSTESGSWSESSSTANDERKSRKSMKKFREFCGEDGLLEVCGEMDYDGEAEAEPSPPNSPVSVSEPTKPSMWSHTYSMKKSRFGEMGGRMLGTGGVKGSVFRTFGALPGMGLMAHKSDFERRWSEDTLFLGKAGTDKSYEEKVELMRKVWEVYMYMKQEGLTFEAAKMYLSGPELASIEEADVLTKGNLLKFLTVLIPDEYMYPFQRVVKPKVPKYYGLPNALAIKIFNIEKKFSMRSVELFREIFKFFPNREYLIVTVPQGSKEPNWLQYFARAVPRIDSSYPNELFIAHKAFFTSTPRVRKGRASDIDAVIKLLETLTKKSQILDDFKQGVCCKRYQTFVADLSDVQNSPIIGLAVVSDELQSEAYHANYQLSNHTYYTLHSQTDHAYVHHFIIYPIFIQFSRAFMKEIMRLMDKTCLYQRVFPEFVKNERAAHQSFLNNMDDWFPVIPRKRIDYRFLNLSSDTYDLERLPPPHVMYYGDPYALIHFGKKFSYEQKVALNARLVFVGASETNLACIAKLLSSCYRGYKRITIIDIFGLPGQLEPNPVRDQLFPLRKGGSSMSYKTFFEWCQRLGLEHWVTTVVGTVTRIHREKKYVVVNKERIVPYDILVLAPGRQFQRVDCPDAEVEDPNFLAFKKRSNKRGQDADVTIHFNKEKPKPKNVFTLNSEVDAEVAIKFIRNYMPFMKRKKILLFGTGIRIVSLVRAFLNLGVAPQRIVIITTPEAEWEARIGYNIQCARGPMVEEMKKLKIFHLENYEFSSWETCPISGLVKRSFFSSSTEVDSKISFATFALFCCRHRRVNDEIVSALAEAYILFQDGIIIDENFLTNDPCIYAAGPAATYKRILMARHLDHLYYESEEIGKKLADMLLKRVGSEGGGIANMQTLDVLKFQKPFVRAMDLLGGWQYLLVRGSGAPLHTRCLDPDVKCDDSCLCSTEIVTGSTDIREDPKQKYIKILLDDKSRVVGIECLSKQRFSASNFAGMFNQHEVILNKMLERLEKGETHDLYEHFCQPWFAVFCTDEWHKFLNELETLYKNHNIGGGRAIADLIREYVVNMDNPDGAHMDPNSIRSVWDESGLRQEVELRFLAFLKFHKDTLPMYARNDYVEELLEERSLSTLYHPRPVQY